MHVQLWFEFTYGTFHQHVRLLQKKKPLWYPAIMLVLVVFVNGGRLYFSEIMLFLLHVTDVWNMQKLLIAGKWTDLTDSFEVAEKRSDYRDSRNPSRPCLLSQRWVKRQQTKIDKA